MSHAAGPASVPRRLLWPVLKWILFAIVLAFVIRHGHRLWVQAQAQEVASHEHRIHVGWLVVSLLLSVLAWLPSVWYWRLLLRVAGENVSWRAASRAYFCGHLGKYIPGKAAALAIRATLLKAEGVRLTHAAFTSAYETLAYMVAGVFVFLFLAPFLPGNAWIPDWQPDSTVARLCVGLVTVAAGVLLWLAVSGTVMSLVRRMARRVDADPSAMDQFAARTCLLGVVPMMSAWFVQGLSLGCVVAAVSPDRATLADWPFWTAAQATANVIGFVAVFAPAGVGVREGLLMTLLEPTVGPSAAVLAALLSRAVSFVGEIVTAGALYYTATPSTNRA